MLGLTQQQVAERIGVTYQQAHKYEKGDNRISVGPAAPDRAGARRRARLLLRGPRGGTAGRAAAAADARAGARLPEPAEPAAPGGGRRARPRARRALRREASSQGLQRHRPDHEARHRGHQEPSPVDAAQALRQQGHDQEPGPEPEQGAAEQGAGSARPRPPRPPRPPTPGRTSVASACAGCRRRGRTRPRPARPATGRPGRSRRAAAAGGDACS